MSKIKIRALGGMGENGKNMYLVEVDDKIFILDAGLIYPKVDLFGIDAVVPNIDYLIQNKERIQGVFISHGHEDHIGALPYLLKNISVRVYATPFTISLIETYLKNEGLNLKNFKLFKVSPNKTLKFNDVKISFYNVNHALPDAANIIISTKDGDIVYSTDFNFSKPLNELYKISYEKLLELSKSKVLAVMAESVGISDSNRTTTDALFEVEIYNSFAKNNNKIFIAAYSTDVSRIQKIINTANLLGKKVAFFSKQTELIVNVALKTNNLSIPEDTLVKLDGTEYDNLVVIVVGNHTEPYYLISRIIEGKYKNIKISSDDLIIGLSDAVSGTEKYVLHVLDEIYRNDIKFKQIENKILRTSHATSDDLIQLYSIAKPKYYIPIKGEVRHLFKHYTLLNELKIPQEKVLNLQDGNILVFENGNLISVENHELKEVYVDGSLTGAVNEDIVSERDALANNGVIEIIVHIDSKTQKIIKDANIITKGLVINKFTEEYIDQMHQVIERLIKSYFLKKNFIVEDLEKAIVHEINKIVHKITKMHTTIIPIIIDLKNIKY